MRRAKFRKGLNRLYLPIYDFLCNNLPDEWQPYYGLRTVEEQDALFNQRPPVTRARGGESAHNYGRASDWTIFIQGKPIWTLLPGEWAFFAQMVEKAEGEWGGAWKSFKDRPHVELPIRVSWKRVGEVYMKDGMEAALKFIEGNKL